MYFDKLVSLLSAFSKDDIRQLDVYIHSPYFNVASASIALFDYLVPLYPDFPQKRLEPEYIAKRMKALPTAATQRTAGTRLLKAIEHFIALEDWQSNDLNVAFHQFHSLKQLQRFDDFAAEYQKIIDKIEADTEQDVDTFFNRHRFTELSSNTFDARLNRTISNEITPTLKTLDAFYALKLLRYMCEAVSRKQILGTWYEETHVISVLKILEPYTNEKYPYVYLFVNVYQMLVADKYETGETHYILIKQFIAAQTSETLPPSSQESMSYAINWCLYWYGKGFMQMGNEYLWWTELKIKYSLLLEDGKLLPITFRNVVALAVLSDLPPEWMKQFIKQYAPRLPAEHHDSYLAFAQGLYNYRTKNFTKAMQLFSTAQAKEDVTFNVIIRRWQYMSTYENDRDDTDLLLNQLHSFEKYIARNREALHQRKEVFIMFIEYAKKILEITDKKERLKLKAELEKEEYFPAKPWLLQLLQ